MKDLKEFDFQQKVLEMTSEFGGYEDSVAICNFEFNGEKVQVRISLVCASEDNYSDYEGIPTIELPDLDL